MKPILDFLVMNLADLSIKVILFLELAPDDKVAIDCEYGLLEVTCSEKYKNIDPKRYLLYLKKSTCFIQ